jgi:peptide/nickel transport system substrate-binding protein
VTSIDLVRALADRANPRCPGYNARWADLLQTIVASDESQIEIRLNRSFLKPEGWLLGPIGPAHAAWDGWVTTSRGRLPVGDGPFEWVDGDDNSAVYQVHASEASNRIKRIREVRFSNPSLALAAFLRGDTAMIEHLPPDRVPALSKRSEYQVGRYAHPVLHRIAVDGRNPVLRNRTLRRGLSYAIDRKTLLEENILKRASDETNTISDGPFAKGTYADATGVQPLEFQPFLGKMLIAAARKEMGGGPIKLRFEYPSTPEAKAVVPKIAEAWRLLDVEIETIERSESELEQAIRSGRPFDLAYRAGPVIEPIWDAGPFLCPAYDAPPAANGLNAIASPRILDLLLRLERAPEVPSASGLVVTIDRESRDELPVLPLWQLEDHYAWRTRLKGPSETAANLYQGIDSWEIEPWFARDPW